MILMNIFLIIIMNITLSSNVYILNCGERLFFSVCLSVSFSIASCTNSPFALAPCVCLSLAALLYSPCNLYECFRNILGPAHFFNERHRRRRQRQQQQLTGGNGNSGGAKERQQRANNFAYQNTHKTHASRPPPNYCSPPSPMHTRSILLSFITPWHKLAHNALLYL